MTKRQRVSIIIVVALFVLGLGAYGTYSLMAKMNQVKELNGQIAEADESDDPPGSDNATQPGGRGEEEEEPVGDGADGEPADDAEHHPDQGGGASPGTGDNAAGGVKPSAAANPGSTAAPRTTDKPAQPNDGKPDSSGTQPPEASPTPVDPEERKQAIDKSVTASMESLRTACKAKSAELVAQIKADVASDKEAALETIQKEYLGQIVAAEASCDAEFAQLVGQAQEQYKAAGIAESGLPNWSAEYEKAKVEARTNALTEIASAMK